MTLIPGTQTRAVFMQLGFHTDSRGEKVQDYAHLYQGAPAAGDLVLASLNAGNTPGLYVGGGGINLGFERALQGAGQSVGRYATRHSVLAQTGSQPGTGGPISTTLYPDTDPCAVITANTTRVTGARDHTGLVFLDTFDDQRSPHANPANHAMLYIAPPDGKSAPYKDGSTADFLDAVSQTAQLAIDTLAAHNTWAAANAAPVIQALRLCMFSSNIYNKSGVPLEDVAMAIYKGCAKALVQTQLALKELQMPVGNPGYELLYAPVQDHLTAQ